MFKICYALVFICVIGCQRTKTNAEKSNSNKVISSTVNFSEAVIDKPDELLRNELKDKYKIISDTLYLKGGDIYIKWCYDISFYFGEPYLACFAGDRNKKQDLKNILRAITDLNLYKYNLYLYSYEIVQEVNKWGDTISGRIEVLNTFYSNATLGKLAQKWSEHKEIEITEIADSWRGNKYYFLPNNTPEDIEQLKYMSDKDKRSFMKQINDRTNEVRKALRHK